MLDRPVFLMGCPRSGTTIVHDVMASHGEFAWISRRQHASPRDLEISRAIRVYRWPWLGPRLYRAATRGGGPWPGRIRRRLPRPAEAWGFWETYLPNFRWPRGGEEPPRRRTADDMTDEQASRIREVLETVARHQGRSRFLAKYTGLPRMAYLSRAFPDARFVHVVRDGRAVAASYLTKIEKGRFGTWDERDWWIRGWPESWREEWAGIGTPIAFVAYQWKFFVNAIREEAAEIGPDRYVELPYAEAVEDPEATFGKALEFCGLRASRRFRWYARRAGLRSMDHKWREKFSDEEQEMLTSIVGNEWMVSGTLLPSREKRA